MKTFNQVKCLSIMLASGLLVGTQMARAATITVTSTADNSSNDGQVTLREAISAANNNTDQGPDVAAHRVGTYGDDIIVFAANVTPTITIVGSHLPAISDNLTINGPGVNALTVISSIYGTSPRFSIFLVDLGVTATFTNLTVSAGAAAICIEDSGGIVAINNCRVDGTTTTNISTDGVLSTSSSTTHTLTVNNSTIKSCGHQGINYAGPNFVINNSTIYNNAAGEQSQGGTTSMTNCTFNGNGQAISGIDAAISVTNCTIAGNTYGFITNGLTVTRKNTICVDPVVVPGFSTFFTNLGNNLTSGNHVAPLANNGGPTLTMMPLVGSPAIDGGKSSAPVTTDQRGLARPFNDPNIANATGGDASDIGAVEARPSVKININSVTAMEYNYGTAYVYFTISLSAAETFPVTVTYTTVNGTALASAGDYVTATGSVTFSPGQRSKAIGVLVKGDLLVEPNEDFMVNLSNPIGGVIAAGQGVCTILNDD